MVAAAYDEFGTWSNACRAAGLHDDSVERPGNRIRARRLELGLSQVALAERIGVSHTVIRFWETGRNPDPRVSIALRIARALECCVEDVCGADAEETASQDDL